MKALFFTLVFSASALAAEVFTADVKCGSEVITVRLSAATNLPKTASVSKVCHRGKCLDWFYFKEAVSYSWQIEAPSLFETSRKDGVTDVGVIPSPYWGYETSYINPIGYELKQGDLTLWVNTGFNKYAQVAISYIGNGVRSLQSMQNLNPGSFGLNVRRADGSFLCNEIGNFAN